MMTDTTESQIIEIWDQLLVWGTNYDKLWQALFESLGVIAAGIDQIIAKQNEKE